MSEETNKGIPDAVPPAPASATEAGDSNVTVEQLEQLMNGDVSFQQFLNLSDDVLLAWANQGYFFYQQGKYEEAETIFKGLVTLNANIAYYHTALGSIYEAQEKYEDALNEFETALGLDAEDICAIVNRGEIRLRQGQVVEAAQDFQKGIELDERNMKAQVDANEKPTPDPAAQRARALAKVTFDVLKEIEARVKEAQEKGEIPAE